jgi:hypothetical protein
MHWSLSQLSEMIAINKAHKFFCAVQHLRHCQRVMSPCPGLCDQRLREPVPTERVGETGPWSLRWKQKKTPLPTGEDSIH